MGRKFALITRRVLLRTFCRDIRRKNPNDIIRIADQLSTMQFR